MERPRHNYPWRFGDVGVSVHFTSCLVTHCKECFFYKVAPEGIHHLLNPLVLNVRWSALVKVERLDTKIMVIPTKRT